MKIPPGFEWRRQVPPSWQARLHQLTPKTELTTWLQLAWLSGDPWETSTLPDGRQHAGIQRWAIYEMVPLRIWQGIIQAQRARGLKDMDILESYILVGLQGPQPRTLGYYDEVLNRYVTEAEVTQQEWDLFHEHLAVPKLFWIIQGDRGGHRRNFTPMERKYLELRGLPTEAASPGDLPYAEFDERVFEMVARRQRLHAAGSAFLGKDEDEYGAAMVEFRRQLVEWLTEQQRANLESAKLDLSDLPRSGAKEDDPSAAIERRTDRFIRTGSIYPKAGE